MPYSIQCDQDDAQEVASLGGMRDLRQWAAGLPDETSIELQHLLAHGWTQEVAELRQGLQDSLELRPPDADVAGSVRAILAATRDDAEVASLTDGLGAGRGGPHVPAGSTVTEDFDPAKHPRDQAGKFSGGEGEVTLTKGVDLRHPAVVHITREVGRLNKLASKLTPGSKEHTANRKQVAKLRADRKKIWDGLVAEHLARGGQLAGRKPKGGDDKEKKDAKPAGLAPFKTASDWRGWMKEQASSSPYGSATPFKAVQSFTSSSDAIRKNQRSGGVLSPTTLAFEAAVARAPRSDGPIYRGMTLKEGSDTLNAFLTKGSEITTNTHDSWSKKDSVAGSFAGGAWGSNHSVLITMSKSTSGGDISSVSHFKGEHEVVVPKNTTYKVVQVVKDDRGKNKHTVFVQEV